MKEIISYISPLKFYLESLDIKKAKITVALCDRYEETNTNIQSILNSFEDDDFNKVKEQAIVLFNLLEKRSPSLYLAPGSDDIWLPDELKSFNRPKNENTAKTNELSNLASIRYSLEVCALRLRSYSGKLINRKGKRFISATYSEILDNMKTMIELVEKYTQLKDVILLDLKSKVEPFRNYSESTETILSGIFKTELDEQEEKILSDELPEDCVWNFSATGRAYDKALARKSKMSVFKPSEDTAKEIVENRSRSISKVASNLPIVKCFQDELILVENTEEPKIKKLPIVKCEQDVQVLVDDTNKNRWNNPEDPAGNYLRNLYETPNNNLPIVSEKEYAKIKAKKAKDKLEYDIRERFPELSVYPINDDQNLLLSNSYED